MYTGIALVHDGQAGLSVSMCPCDLQPSEGRGHLSPFPDPEIIFPSSPVSRVLSRWKLEHSQETFRPSVRPPAPTPSAFRLWPPKCLLSERKTRVPICFSSHHNGAFSWLKGLPCGGQSRPGLWGTAAVSNWIAQMTELSRLSVAAGGQFYPDSLSVEPNFPSSGFVLLNHVTPSLPYLRSSNQEAEGSLTASRRILTPPRAIGRRNRVLCLPRRETTVVVLPCLASRRVSDPLPCLPVLLVS